MFTNLVSLNIVLGYRLELGGGNRINKAAAKELVLRVRPNDAVFGRTSQGSGDQNVRVHGR